MKDEDPVDDRTVTSSEAFESKAPKRRPPGSTRLGALASFSELRSSLLREIESSMTERRFATGEPLMRQGDPGDCLMVIQNGHVEVSVVPDGERHVLKRSGAGEVFGEMALLTREPRTASVVALEPVTALVLAVDDFHRLARREPALAEVLSRLTAQRLGGGTHDALSGKAFHGYTIRKRLGRGGMAVVYEADEEGTGRRVALKMMSHRFAFHEAAKRRFQQEADLIASFEHPNIARMFGRFEAFHTFFIVMELCDGASLDRILDRRGRLDADDSRRILGQLASALAYAHGRDVVHRDVKPSNVMVNRDGVVKLMDFGLARPLLEGRGDTGGTLAGTPPYLAPEQLAEEPFGTAADVFSLGALAWEMVTGKTLFAAKDFATLRKEHDAWKVPDPAAALPGGDPDLVDFLSASLDRDPRRRPESLDRVIAWAAPVDFPRLAAE
jgi:hypothetical protein